MNSEFISLNCINNQHHAHHASGQHIVNNSDKMNNPYIRPPTFASDSDSEAPDPFAYVPLSKTPKKRSKKRSPRKSISRKRGPGKSTSFKSAKSPKMSMSPVKIDVKVAGDGAEESGGINKVTMKPAEDINTGYKAMEDPNHKVAIKNEEEEADPVVQENNANAVEEDKAVEDSDADLFAEDSDADLFVEESGNADVVAQVEMRPPRRKNR